ncbi:Chaperone protein [Moritella sp. PE36]|uniref:HD domain-containing protein n=1 Tax=Moritella sp. PE36 TaxID=58051 RepID=UPI000156968B|nr:ATP-binding protein [Moritella sp. PE36]EDM64882.1 Chaperone protein [Moritella sp. PE36]
MKLFLPEKFRKKINTKTNLSGALDTLVDTFSDWLTNNKTEFFPEYTDHGIDHIQSVLNTAEEIISDDAWDILTPEDIYVLTSSVLLHDCAMHISKEGLWDLISNDLYNGVLLGFDRENEWSSRWSDFCNEVARFDEYDYHKFFGGYREVVLPEIGSNSLEDNQKILIGDFVRRYHACIAQVISTHGIPSSKGAVDIFDSNFKYLNQLSGLIARSHNHKLRDIVDLLGDGRARKHRNTHPTFLMGVLRVADYLQLKSDRTPKILFNTIAFCSPISNKEWKKHLSIISTHDFHPDDELLFIEAYPEDAKTLVGIKHLLTGLQQELDEYWAVTGEVYSRYAPLDKLKLTYRRVKSNIDNPIKYVETNHKMYHPEVLSVKADNQKLFPLLIKPLYGDLPQVGVRELLQNSLDATNERYSQEIEGNVNELNIPHEITINIDFDKNIFELTDNGVGMDVAIIKNYFLKIGSSYRTSEQWRSTFSEDGTTRVPRTGKFGIGMLAGFLIGDEIEIHTKSMSGDSRGIHFRYTLDSNEIELRVEKKREIGTNIKIHTDHKRLKIIHDSLNINSSYRGSQYYRHGLSSWWYYLDSPKVNVFVKKDETCKSIKKSYSIEKNKLLADWINISDSDLNSFYWRHYDRSELNVNNIYCNGIILQKMKPPKIEINTSFGDILLNNIEICIFDNDGRFPLNLTRDGLVTDNFYEIEKLTYSVKKTYIERCISSASNHDYSEKFISNLVSVALNSKQNMSFFPFIFTEEKVYPFAGKEHGNESKYIFVDFTFPRQKRGFIYSVGFNQIKNDIAYSCFPNSDKTGTTIERAINSLLFNRDSLYFGYTDGVDTNQLFSAWIYIKKKDFSKLADSTVKFIESNGITVETLNDWVVVSKNEDADNLPELGNTIINFDDTNMFIFSLYKVVEVNSTEFSELWESNLIATN